MNARAEPLGGIGRIHLEQDDVRGDNLGQFFKLSNETRGVLMHGGAEPEVAGSEMDLHGCGWMRLR